MNFRYCHAVSAILASALMFPVIEAEACACCTDPGEYRLETNKPMDSFKRGEIAAIRFSPAAELYLTVAIYDAVKGIAGISEPYTISGDVDAKQWRLTFRGDDGKSGVLTLPIPAKMTTYAADIHDNEGSRTRAPVLYKEWRFEGVAKGDGIFEGGFTAPARYTLVFQGRGNRCDERENFTHWRLEVSGRKASYAFFGTLAAPRP